MKRNLRNYIYLWFREDLHWKKLINITRIAETASILGLLYAVYFPLSEDLDATIAIGFIGIICLFFLLDNILLKGKIYFQFLEYETLRSNARIADSINNLNVGFKHVHTLERKAEVALEDYYSSFRILADQLASLFNNYQAGRNYSVCIKIFQDSENNKKPAVTTLVRDLSNDDRNLKVDANFGHDVEKNTAFMHILKNIGKAEGRIFRCNELPYLKGYQNTSFTFYSSNFTTQGLPQEMEDSERLKNWPLPYKSCLVVPIDDHISKSNKETLLGFLCVDSSQMNAFDNDILEKILFGVSDGLYNSLNRFLKKLKNGQKG